MTTYAGKDVGDWGHYFLLVKGQIGAVTLEISVTVPHETENQPISRSNYTTLGDWTTLIPQLAALGLPSAIFS